MKKGCLFFIIIILMFIFLPRVMERMAAEQEAMEQEELMFMKGRDKGGYNDFNSPKDEPDDGYSNGFWDE